MNPEQPITKSRSRRLLWIVLFLLVSNAVTIGLITWNFSGGQDEQSSNEAKRASAPKLTRLTTLPLAMPPEDRSLEWYSVGGDAFALASTFTMEGGDSSYNTAEFRVLGVDGGCVISASNRLPLKVSVIVEKVGPGRVMLSYEGEQLELVAPGGAPPMDWAVLEAQRMTPATSSPVIGASDVHVPAGGYKIIPPKDPRLAQAPVEEAVAAEEEIPTEEVYTDIPFSQWPGYSERVMTALKDDVLYKDAIDEQGAVYGARAASFREPNGVLAECDLRKGDVLLRIQEIDIYSVLEVNEALLNADIREGIDLLIYRDGHDVLLRILPYRGEEAE